VSFPRHSPGPADLPLAYGDGTHLVELHDVSKFKRSEARSVPGERQTYLKPEEEMEGRKEGE
jgi:hypothetical protein